MSEILDTLEKSGTPDKSFFDVVYPRKNSGSVKFDARPKGKKDDNIIPMWIADMDFKIAPEIEAALIKSARHGIFGYNEPDAEYDRALVSWYKRRMNWEISPQWVLKAPTVMFSIGSAIRSLTNEGDSVIICQPVYYPFEKIVTRNRRNLVVSTLYQDDGGEKNESGKYKINFDDFEKKIIDNKVKLFLLCSPHNPVSRVWTREELLEIGQICLRNNVTIVSDEIHSDLILKGFTHIPIASLSQELADITITCTAPTKTFNLAGLQAANTIISNPDIRQKVFDAGLETGYSGMNTMAIESTKAAYLHGEGWLSALLDYLGDNVEIINDYLSQINSLGNKISLISPEGTYLLWLDCRGLGLSDRELESFFLDEANLWLHKGPTFGSGGSGFMRMNIACPKKTLITAMERIKTAVSRL